jgi:ketosteroid isomerase-like protein
MRSLCRAKEQHIKLLLTPLAFVPGGRLLWSRVDARLASQRGGRRARGILPVMAEESTAPDLVELVRRSVEAADKRDLDAHMAFYAPDAVWDASPMGIGTFEGQAAMRGFWEDWLSSYEGWELQTVEVQELGNGVTFAVLDQRGRLVGSSGEIELRYASVTEWEDGKIVRITNYTDIDEARAAAERLAEERG